MKHLKNKDNFNKINENLQIDGELEKTTSSELVNNPSDSDIIDELRNNIGDENLLRIYKKGLEIIETERSNDSPFDSSGDWK